MNELIEMIELQERLNSLIESEISEMSDRDVQILKESGILSELNFGQTKAAITSVGTKIAGSNVGKKVAKFGVNLLGDKKNQTAYNTALSNAKKSLEALEQRAAKYKGKKTVKKIARAKDAIAGEGGDIYVASRKLANSQKRVKKVRTQAATAAAGTAVAAGVVGGGVAANRKPKTRLEKIREKLGLA